MLNINIISKRLKYKYKIILFTIPFLIFLLFIQHIINPYYEISFLDENNIKYDKGIVICASENDDTIMSGMEYSINAIRNNYNSNIKITINHCTEISNSKINELKNSYNNLYFNDICINNNNYYYRKRMKSVFCKTMALIQSPYNETILIDADIIWFQNPINLFNSPGYKRTGALYFRDRFLYETNIEKDGLNYNYVVNLIELLNKNIKITQEIATKYFNNNGISFFWKYGMNNTLYKPIKHVQESSVVIFDKRNHKDTINVLKKLLPYFKLGFGDKEIYWISTMIANENFEWEPYLFGIYGNCGEIFHYDPTLADIYRPPLPYFLNGQYLLDSASKRRNRLSNVISKPIYVDKNTKLFEMGVKDEFTKGRCNACDLMGCTDIPIIFNKELNNYFNFQKVSIEEKLIK
jgi:hypothetical protein